MRGARASVSTRPSHGGRLPPSRRAPLHWQRRSGGAAAGGGKAGGEAAERNSASSAGPASPDVSRRVIARGSKGDVRGAPNVGARSEANASAQGATRKRYRNCAVGSSTPPPPAVFSRLRNPSLLRHPIGLSPVARSGGEAGPSPASDGSAPNPPSRSDPVIARGLVGAAGAVLKRQAEVSAVP